MQTDSTSSDRRDGGWPEMHDHFVQFYDEDAVILDSASRFLVAGLISGGACIVIATQDHRLHFGTRLRARGFDLDHAIETGQYIALDAATLLPRLMVGNTPDPARFEEIVEPVLAKAELHYPHVFAFGEMVALLAGDGEHGAAVELEKLWNQLAVRHTFSLFCAYPRSAFSADDHTALDHVCAQHSQVVP
jgi:hypothetical protein